MTLATWLTSGWIDFGVIAAWMLAVALIGGRAWRRSRHG
jgi:hypothetical protein